MSRTCPGLVPGQERDIFKTLLNEPLSIFFFFCALVDFWDEPIWLCFIFHLVFLFSLLFLRRELIFHLTRRPIYTRSKARRFSPANAASHFFFLYRSRTLTCRTPLNNSGVNFDFVRKDGERAVCIIYMGLFLFLSIKKLKNFLLYLSFSLSNRNLWSSQFMRSSIFF